MARGTRLDRANWAVVQEGTEEPTENTKGNIYIQDASPDSKFWLRSESGSWIEITDLVLNPTGGSTKIGDGTPGTATEEGALYITDNLEVDGKAEINDGIQVTATSGSNRAGVYGRGGPSNGIGVQGSGDGAGAGVEGQSDAGPGVVAYPNSTRGSIVIVGTGSSPSTPSPGEMYYNSGNNTMYYWNNSIWVAM